jgi:hypothetical protein
VEGPVKVEPVRNLSINFQFDPNTVPLQMLNEQEAMGNISEDWDANSVASSKLSYAIRGNEILGKMPISSVVGGAAYTQSISPDKPDMRRRSSDERESVQGKHIPSDDELLKEIRHILSTSDLMTITKKKVRQQLSEFYGVDLSSKKQYIHAAIDSILKGE